MSGPAGIDGYGLTSKGREQAAEAARQLQGLCGAAAPRVCVVSSPFLRAKQTAEIVLSTLTGSEQTQPALRDGLR